MLLAFHTPRHETNIKLYTHHSTPPCSLRVSPARALRRTSSRNRSWNVGVSPIFESLSKGMGSIRRSTRCLARLRHTKVNPAVDSDFPRSSHGTSLSGCLCGKPPFSAQMATCGSQPLKLASEALLHVCLNPRL